MEHWTLTFDNQRADVVARGAAVRTYRVKGRDMIDGFDLDELPPAFEGAALAPWPNRIRDGRWTLDGEVQQLAVTEPATGTALHGLVCWAQWRGEQAAAESVTLRIGVLPQPGYPFELDLETTYSLNAGGLRCDTTATNRSPAPAPFGYSVHPFFGFDGVPVEQLRLTIPAGTWQDVDERLLPTHLRPISELTADLSGGSPLGETALDTAFTDLEREPDGSITARLQGGEHVTTVWADESFSWWQVYTSDQFPADDPRHRRSVAIEPMTCGPDAFNSHRDVVWIEPGGSWRGSWGVRPGA